MHQKGNLISYFISFLLGGTVDVSVHEVLGDRNLRELYKASGGAWGGTTVDKAYENVLVKIFGQNIFNKFKKENRDDYIAIFRKFEVRKRATSTTTERDTIISLPATLVETYVEEIGFSLRVAVQNSTVSHFVTPERGNKLRIKAAFMRKLFSVATCNIVTHISELLCFDVVKGAKTIIMVGGLSESSILHETMKLEFPTLNVVVPPDADLSVLKGAVVFGFQPTAITERISRYTYGLEVALPFEDDVHPADKRWHDGKGVPLCCGCFSKIIGCGRQMKLREQIRCETMLRPTSTTGMGFSVYGSTEHDPKYVTDDYCFFVGSFEIVFPDDQNPENLNRKFRVSLGLGDTELRVVARDVHTKELYRAKVKLKDI